MKSLLTTTADRALFVLVPTWQAIFWLFETAVRATGMILAYMAFQDKHFQAALQNIAAGSGSIVFKVGNWVQHLMPWQATLVCSFFILAIIHLVFILARKAK